MLIKKEWGLRMRISKRDLIKIISESIESVMSPQHVEYYTFLDEDVRQEVDQLDQEYKDFLFLMGYVCGFEILQNVNPNYSKQKITVTSGKRDGLKQVEAWLGKMAAGEAEAKTLSYYRPGLDPFMTPETARNSELAYDQIQAILQRHEADPDYLKKNLKLARSVGNFIDANPVSSHSTGEALDFRIIGGRKSFVTATLDFMIDNDLANFFYQFEPDPPHIHIGPTSAGAPVLTPKGREALNAYSGLANEYMTKNPNPAAAPGASKVAQFYWRALNALYRKSKGKIGMYE